jgi:hypothetical protein
MRQKPACTAGCKTCDARPPPPGAVCEAVEESEIAVLTLNRPAEGQVSVR